VTKQTAGTHRYVLDIFEANTRLSLHQSDRAVDLFLTALTADPTITGAWVDLGTLYYNGFNADAARACWDAARILRPTHFMVKQIDDRERKLRIDHPEFF
jgi:Flp pilus assembly protein TadD